MTTVHERFDRLDDPRLRRFLPLLYVAWADGTLEDAERRAIVDRLAGEDWMTPGARHELEGWLDATRPPTPAEMHSLRGLIESACDRAPGASRRSLVALGAHVDLAAEGAGAEDTEASTAAHDVAAILGVESL